VPDVDRPADGPTTDGDAWAKRIRAATTEILDPGVVANLSRRQSMEPRNIRDLCASHEALRAEVERLLARPTREQIRALIAVHDYDEATDRVMALYDQPDPGMPTKAETDALAEAILANARAKEAADHDALCERELVTSRLGSGWTACQCSTRLCARQGEQPSAPPTH
jgi:hypothetical protein